MTERSAEKIDIEIGTAMAKHFAEQFNYNIDHKIKTGEIDFLGIALPFILAERKARDEAVIRMRDKCAETAEGLYKDLFHGSKYVLASKAIAKAIRSLTLEDLKEKTNG